jgi:DNA-binding NtrC family response regulator
MSAMPQGDRLRVLVVDDDATVLRSIERLLREKMHVATFKSAGEALRAIGPDEFDVVCADYGMPEMSGLDLFERLTSIDAHTGRLLITGSSAQAWAHDSSADGVLLKPFDPPRFLAMILELGQVAKARREGKPAHQAGEGR